MQFQVLSEVNVLVQSLVSGHVYSPQPLHTASSYEDQASACNGAKRKANVWMRSIMKQYGWEAHVATSQIYLACWSINLYCSYSLNRAELKKASAPSQAHGAAL